jgi:putative hemolysin
VVPIFFDGHTSRLFQMASHLHYTLRMGLLIKEFRKRVDTAGACRRWGTDPRERSTRCQRREIADGFPA